MLGGLGTLVRHPAIGLPDLERLSALYLKQIDHWIGSLRSQFVQRDSIQEPFGRKFRLTIVQILALKYTEGEHLAWIRPGFEIGCEAGSRFFRERIGIPFGHFIRDVYCFTAAKRR